MSASQAAAGRTSTVGAAPGGADEGNAASVGGADRGGVLVCIGFRVHSATCGGGEGRVATGMGRREDCRGAGAVPTSGAGARHPLPGPSHPTGRRRRPSRRYNLHHDGRKGRNSAPVGGFPGWTSPRRQGTLTGSARAEPGLVRPARPDGPSPPPEANGGVWRNDTSPRPPPTPTVRRFEARSPGRQTNDLPDSRRRFTQRTPWLHNRIPPSRRRSRHMPVMGRRRRSLRPSRPPARPTPSSDRGSTPRCPVRACVRVPAPVRRRCRRSATGGPTIPDPPPAPPHPVPPRPDRKRHRRTARPRRRPHPPLPQAPD